MAHIGTAINPLCNLITRFSSLNLQRSLFSSHIPCVLFSSSIVNAAAPFSQGTLSHASLKKKLLHNQSRNEFQMQKRGYSMRLELTEYGIMWRRPEAIPQWRPEKAGDLAPAEELDRTKSTLAFLPVESELAKADEVTQRVLSLEFSNDSEVLKVARYRMKRKVQQHAFDNDSLEVKVAMGTAHIRHLQKFFFRFPTKGKNIRKRVQLQEMVDKRKMMLRIIRLRDYKKFEWLIEQLDLVYKPHPVLLDKPVRRVALRRLVSMHCEQTRQDRLEKYRLQLESLKKPFLKEKRETLQWIADTETKLGIAVSVEVPAEAEGDAIFKLASGVSENPDSQK